MALSEDKIQEAQQWVEDYGDVLFRFALSRVRDKTLAEDLVQTAFVSAMTANRPFEGKSSMQTWLLGILKHKILDHFRKSKRNLLLEDLPEVEASLSEGYDHTGHMKGTIPRWGMNPEQIWEEDEIQKILHACIDKLSDKMRTLFILREMDGTSTETICEQLQISSSNFGVMLHRARHQLRACFEKHGIGKLS